ncbi:MAG: lysylphosphatidylglycerol synthase domain-containing protein [Sinobacteraceae bacterium]|nr:lysylphosphatidylglycerol synthase domain-containing protein [Nevskiaceae bacterium]
MKRLSLIAGLLGLALAIALIVHQGWAAIGQSLATAGLGLLWLVPFHGLPIALDAEGWRALLAPRDGARSATRPFLFWIASVREAVNRLLPVASIGGEIVGIRLALLRPLPGTAVTASVILEVLLTLINQYLFTALGLVLLVTLLSRSELSDALWWGLLVSLPVPLALYALLRYGDLFARLERFLLKLLGDDHKLAALFVNAAALDAEIRAMYRRQARLWAALFWQLAGMVAGSFETWLALRLLGHPVGAWQAVTVESLSLALRNFAFFVPAGVGVQEAGLILFGNLIGLPADASIALSLAKRVREIGYGVPFLLSWQWLEARRLGLRLRARSAAAGAKQRNL